jgi:hypothetical protein
MEMTPAGVISHTGYTAVLFFAVATAVSVAGFFRSPWRHWWSKLPLLVLIVVCGYVSLELLVRYVAFAR